MPPSSTRHGIGKRILRVQCLDRAHAEAFVGPQHVADPQHQRFAAPSFMAPRVTTRVTGTQYARKRARHCATSRRAQSRSGSGSMDGAAAGLRGGTAGRFSAGLRAMDASRRRVHVPRELQMHPEHRVGAEIIREPPRRVGGDRAAPADHLVDAAARYAERAGELGLIDRERRQEPRFEEMARVQRRARRERKRRRPATLPVRPLRTSAAPRVAIVSFGACATLRSRFRLALEQANAVDHRAHASTRRS